MNKYIAIYEHELKKGKSIDIAFINASAYVAASGTIDDLRDLHFRHMQNGLDEIFNNLEVSNNE